MRTKINNKYFTICPHQTTENKDDIKDDYERTKNRANDSTVKEEITL
jgi:hypothetical protein